MQLYFLRHGLAESSWNGDDFHRPLTDEGRTQMEKAAKTMKAVGLELDRIFSSPLTRALETAELVARRLNLTVDEDDRVAAGFDIDSLGHMLSEYGQEERIMFVGHEPSFSMVLGSLVGGADIVCEKGSLARVDLYSTSPPQGRLMWMIPPKLLSL
jgi:phosphohistidine phosphatase